MDDQEALRRELEELRAENARLRARAFATTEDLERQWFTGLFEQAPAFVGLVRGKEHVFAMANAQFRNMTGHRPLIGRTVADAIPELAGQGFIELLDGVLRTGQPYLGHETPVDLEYGGRLERRYVNFVYQPVYDLDGAPNGVLAVGIDSTETALVSTRLRALFQAVLGPLYVWQRIVRGDGSAAVVLLDYNAAALETSPDLASQRGETADTVFSNEPSVAVALARCFEDGAPIREECTWSVGSGRRRHLTISYAPAKPDLVLMHIDDRTDRVRLEDNLRQSQKMDAIGRLAGGVAHDFNNLLTVILSCVELRLEPDAPESELESDLLEIRLAGRRARELTAQLLAFSRQQVLTPSLIDIHETVVSLRTMLQRLIGEHVTLSIDPRSDGGRARVDRGQLEQIIVNLLVNARDALGEGGTVTIEVAPAVVTAETPPDDLAPGDYVVISVTDTGAGMDAATVARVFEPFFTTKDIDRGTGLGLATVFGIAKQSGGTVTVTSEKGRGSQFRVYLPRTDAADTRPETQAPPSRSLNGSETILVVEDEDQLRAVICRILRRHGYRVFDAANAGDAFLIAAQHGESIDLLLTDVVMPRLSGPRLSEALSSKYPKLIVLFASGYTDDEVLRAGVRDEKAHFIHKPFTPQALLEKIRSLLD